MKKQSQTTIVSAVTWQSGIIESEGSVNNHFHFVRSGLVKRVGKELVLLAQSYL